MPSQYTLHVAAATTPPGWQAQWFQHDQPVSGPIAVQDQTATAMVHLSDRFLKLFEQGGRPLVDSDALRAIGQSLFATWFAPAWSVLMPDGNGSAPGELVIQSADEPGAVLITPCFSGSWRSVQKSLPQAHPIFPVFFATLRRKASKITIFTPLADLNGGFVAM